MPTANQPTHCIAITIMKDRLYNVLFICTGNSARSIFAECLINSWGARKFRGYSAGSQPTGEIHPLAIYALEHNGYATEGLRSKSWDEFTNPDAPHMDFVFTVCDRAVGEACPLWPSQPMTAHWGVADPVSVQGDRVTRLAASRWTYQRRGNSADGRF